MSWRNWAAWDAPCGLSSSVLSERTNRRLKQLIKHSKPGQVENCREMFETTTEQQKLTFIIVQLSLSFLISLLTIFIHGDSNLFSW